MAKNDNTEEVAPQGSPPVDATMPDPSLASPPVEAPPVEADANDEEDVPAALERDTEDGSGFADESELPESDFDGYAEDDVEVSE